MIMKTTNVLVTGATGFIGSRLVERLVEQGHRVTCFVRPTSDCTALEKLDCSLVRGDVLTNPSSLTDAIASSDWVFHLAASTHAVRSRDLIEINVGGIRNVLEACVNRSPADSSNPKSKQLPTLIYVSSLAAVGPCRADEKVDEYSPLRPVSFYGRSKVACEKLVTEYSDRIPTSILRPPIVLGDGDRHGLTMFQTIEKTGWHFVPGFFTKHYSVIHVDDLVDSMIAIAKQGKRVDQNEKGQGIYFPASDESYSYSMLGRTIGKALGRKRVRVLKVAYPVMWAIGLVNEVVARITGKSQFLDLDKNREAFAGSWLCSNETLKQDTDIEFSVPMLQRLRQTADGYRAKGWLSSLRGISPTQEYAQKRKVRTDDEHHTGLPTAN